jgi:membrane protein DedA with SNARE-associated domain
VSSWLISLITNYGLLIIFVLMAAENACLPIPSEVVVPYGGVLAALGHTHLWEVIVVSTVAALVGAGVV